MQVDELVAKLQAATEGSRELDAAIGKAIGKIPVEWLDDFMPADIAQYSRSLDAALTLVPDRRGWSVQHLAQATAVVFGTEYIRTWANTAPLALCIAALKARSAA